MRRLGCLTPLGIFAGLLTLLIVGGVALASGGVMFSPGALNAHSGDALGGVTSHAQLGSRCVACHADPWSSEIMATRCLNCHADVRAQLNDPKSLHSAMPEVTRCRSCHSEHNGAQAALTHLDVASFPHDRLAFTLATHRTTKAGLPFACVDCHSADITTFAPAQCDTCHRGYQAEFMTQHVADFGKDCLACHDGVDRFTAFDHNRLKFTLAGKHNAVPCGECHTNARAVADFKSASPACVDCHRQDDARAHSGAFGTDCALCHSSDKWDTAQFDHNLAAFKLAGKHVTVECAQCHINSVYKGTPQACVSCHLKDDTHTGAYGTDCAQCHNAGDWKDAQFDHNLAAFKLTGAHVNVTCAKCHINSVYKGTPLTCVGCHADPQAHLGQFGLNCAQCHSTQTWQGATFAHTFPLNHGERANVACKTCHVTTNFKEYTCYGCHEHTQQNIQAKHQGEGISNFQDCMRCHDRGQKEKGGD